MIPTVFISYSHTNTNIADTIYTALRSNSADPIRDKAELEYKDNLTQFMHKIRKTDYAVLIVSQAYLMSTNCMYELLNLLKESNFKEKALPILLDHSLYTESNKMELHLFWNQRKDSYSDKIREFENQSINAPAYLIEERKKAQDICNSLDAVLEYLSDHFLKTFTELEETNFNELFSKIGLPTLDASPKSKNAVVEGFGPKVKIIRGSITYKKCSLNQPALIGLNFSIIGGEIWKNDKGLIAAKIDTLSPFERLQELNKRLGFSEFEVVSGTANEIIKQRTPYQFTGTKDGIIPANEKMIDFSTWKEISIPLDVNTRSLYLVEGALNGNKFKGDFRGTINLSVGFISQPPVELSGSFEIEIV